MKKLFILALLFPILLMQASMIDLHPYEKKIFSQNGEDGITLAILAAIGSTNKYYVEFGVTDGSECNTRFLKEHFNWNGLWMDGGWENESINLRKEFITAENINDLFEKYNVPYEFDVLSIDIDYNDFYVWHALNKKYRPRIIIIEYNSSHSPLEDKVVKYDPLHMWDGYDYFGASILAYKRLGIKKGYTLVYADDNGVNLFFVRSDILKKLDITFKDQNDEVKLYKEPRYFGIIGYRHATDPFQREYVSSDRAIRICHRVIGPSLLIPVLKQQS